MLAGACLWLVGCDEPEPEPPPLPTAAGTYAEIAAAFDEDARALLMRAVTDRPLDATTFQPEVLELLTMRQEDVDRAMVATRMARVEWTPARGGSHLSFRDLEHARTAAFLLWAAAQRDIDIGRFTPAGERAAAGLRLSSQIAGTSHSMIDCLSALAVLDGSLRVIERIDAADAMTDSIRARLAPPLRRVRWEDPFAASTTVTTEAASAAAWLRAGTPPIGFEVDRERTPAQLAREADRIEVFAERLVAAWDDPEAVALLADRVEVLEPGPARSWATSALAYRRSAKAVEERMAAVRAIIEAR